jgi:hypothetical protein
VGLIGHISCWSVLMWIYWKKIKEILIHASNKDGACGCIVVKGLCYKPEVAGFDTWRGEWISSIYLILPAGA